MTTANQDPSQTTANRGNQDFDPDAMEQTRLDAVVRTGSVDVNDPDMEELLAEEDWFDSQCLARIAARRDK